MDRRQAADSDVEQRHAVRVGPGAQPLDLVEALLLDRAAVETCARAPAVRRRTPFR